MLNARDVRDASLKIEQRFIERLRARPACLRRRIDLSDRRVAWRTGSDGELRRLEQGLG